MKIAYIIPSLINSGPIRVVHSLVNELQKEHEIEIYYFKVPQRDKLTFEVPTHQIRFGDAIAFDSYDIIHSHTILADAYLYYHNKKIKRAKMVTTLHNYAKEDLPLSYGQIKGHLMARFWNYITAKHNQIVVLSQDAKRYYQKFWKNKNITYVYNGVPPFKFQGVSKEKTPFIKIGAIASAGGVSKRKGFDQIIKALVYLEGYTLNIIGKETDESQILRELAQELGVFDRVFFLGYTSDIGRFIEEMDLFVVSSLSEGLPLSMLEIARAKKPIVCSKIPIFEEIMRRDDAAFFDLGDIEALKEGVLKVYADLETYGERVYRRYLEAFTTEKMAKNYLKVYGELLDER